MDKKQKITGYLMIVVGVVIFLRLLIRFFNQGYFGNESTVFYLLLFEMKDWFGTIIYSFLFALSGYFLCKNRKTNTLVICQFIAVGIIIDRIWYILDRSNTYVWFSFIPTILVLFVLFYLLLERNGYDGYLKKAGIFILLNLIIIAFGRFILPNTVLN